MMTAAGRLALDGYRQLELELIDEVDRRVPWGGRSPRVLTKAHQTFRLQPRGEDADPGPDDSFIDEQSRRDQYGW